MVDIYIKVLFLAYFFPPVGVSGLPGAQRTVKFLRNLTSTENYVLTVRPDAYPDFCRPNDYNKNQELNAFIHRTGTLDIFRTLIKIKESINLFKKKGKNTNAVKQEYPIQKVDGGSDATLFKWLKDAIFTSLNYPDYAAPWITTGLLNGIATVKKNDVDVVFATGTPWSALVMGALLKKLTDVGFLADFRDPWINNPYQAENNPLLAKISKFLEKFVVENADRVTLNTDALRDEFRRRYPNVDKKKFVTLPNGFDTGNSLKNVNRNTITRKLSPLCLAHAGTLYGARDPAPLLTALKLLVDNKRVAQEKIRFIQIGNDNLNYDLNKYVRENGLQGSFLNLGPMPYDKCMKELSSSDILVNIQQKTRTQIPSKIFDYLCYDKPILTIGHKDGALGQLIRRYHFGKIFDPSEIEKMADFIESLYKKKINNGVLCETYPQKEEFNISRITQKLEDLLFEIRNEKLS